MSQYHLVVKNNSSDPGTICVFQGLPDQSAGPAAGLLHVAQARPIAQATASVGVGLSGTATVKLPVTPQPVYWITFGTYDPVLDPAQLTRSARIEFPPGVHTMTATRNADHTWTVTPGA